MSLGNAFKQTYAQRQDRALLKVIGDAIELGLWPWKPGTIIAYADQDFTRYGQKFTFTNELLPNLPFVTHPDTIRYEPEDLAYKIAQEAFIFYRNRPAIPVDDHIVLGED